MYCCCLQKQLHTELAALVVGTNSQPVYTGVPLTAEGEVRLQQQYCCTSYVRVASQPYFVSTRQYSYTYIYIYINYLVLYILSEVYYAISVCCCWWSCFGSTYVLYMKYHIYFVPDTCTYVGDTAAGYSHISCSLCMWYIHHHRIF